MDDTQEAKKKQIIQLLKNAEPKTTLSCPGCSWWSKALTGATILCFITTMLPLGASTSLLAIATGLFLFSWLNPNFRPSRNTCMIAISLVTASILSGCSPLFTNNDQGVINICEESTGQECKIGTATGWSLFGIPVRDVNIADARIAGSIEDVFGVSTSHGYGVVSVTKVTVYGS